MRRSRKSNRSLLERPSQFQVKVLSPTIEAQKPEQVARKMSVSTPVTGCTLNEDHNLEWTLQLKENEKKDLTVKWQIDYPSTEKLEYKEEH